VGRIVVLAGPNGSGKSSVGGALLRAYGATYFNPDERARRFFELVPSISGRDANSLAWQEGKRRLEQAIAAGEDYNFETTLGGTTITRLLARASEVGARVIVWYVALANPELQIERVGARVGEGGHDIPEADVRKRYDTSRLNLIELMPGLTELQVFDNSKHADVANGEEPTPRLIVSMTKGRIVDHCDLATTPTWAKPILATAFAIDPSALRR
jgi:predicted ABC-type ATPase